VFFENTEYSLGTVNYSKNQLKIYPTVSDGNIVVEQRIGQYEMSIYNLNGQLQWYKELSGTTERLQLDLSPGVYLTTVEFKDGTRETKKLIIL